MPMVVVGKRGFLKIITVSIAAMQGQESTSSHMTSCVKAAKHQAGLQLHIVRMLLFLPVLQDCWCPGLKGPSLQHSQRGTASSNILQTQTTQSAHALPQGTNVAHTWDA
jgi:hypothetical protein